MDTKVMVFFVIFFVTLGCLLQFEEFMASYEYQIMKFCAYFMFKNGSMVEKCAMQDGSVIINKNYAM
jgi:hypothetical protein